MKLASFVLAAAVLALVTPASAQRSVRMGKSKSFPHLQVKPYTRSNGTKVESYHRTRADKWSTNNWTKSGNSNPFTGQVGMRPGHDGPAVRGARTQPITQIKPVRGQTYKPPVYKSPPTYKAPAPYKPPTYTTPPSYKAPAPYKPPATYKPPTYTSPPSYKAPAPYKPPATYKPPTYGAPPSYKPPSVYKPPANPYKPPTYKPPTYKAPAPYKPPSFKPPKR